MKDKITHDNAVNTLRAARVGIESHLAEISAEMLGYRHTIREQGEEIDKLKAQLKDAEDRIASQREVIIEYASEAREARCHSEQRYRNDELFDWAAETAKMVGRAKNVTRLASAAINHIEAGRLAIAKQLITPLAQGVHDAYKEDS